MKNSRLFSMILVIGICLALSCQIADLLASTPTPPPAQSTAVVRNTIELPTVHTTNVLPTLAPIQPTVTVVPPSPTTQVVIEPTQPPATIAPPSPTTQVVVTPTQPPASPTTALPPGCADPNATITSLTDNGTVSGLIEIHGTAARPNMDYWKVEFRPEASTNYDVLNKSDKALTDGVLARLSTKTSPNGVYYIRLVIVLKDGNFATPCEFRVTFAN